MSAEYKLGENEKECCFLMAAQYGYIYIDASENPMNKNAASKGRVIVQIAGVWVLKMNTTDNNAVDIGNLTDLRAMGGESFALQTYNAKTEQTHRAVMTRDKLEELIEELTKKNTTSDTGARLAIPLDKNGNPTGAHNLIWQVI